MEQYYISLCNDLIDIILTTWEWIYVLGGLDAAPTHHSSIITTITNKKRILRLGAYSNENSW